MRVPILVKLAAEDPNVEIRYYAKKALSALKGAVGEGEEAPVLPFVATIREMFESEDFRIRFAALKRAIENPSPEVIGLVRTGIDREPNHQLKATFIVALGRIGSNEDVEFLAELLTDGDARIRANTVEALATIGTEKALRHLVPLLQDPDNRVKANAVKALQAYGGPSLLNLLRLMAMEESVWMRDSAFFALTHLRDPQSLDLIAQMARDDPLQRIREKARHHLLLIAKEGNELAARILVDLGVPFGVPSGVPFAPAPSLKKDEGEKKIPQEEKPEAIDLKSSLVLHENPTRRRIGLLKVSEALSLEDGPLLVRALRTETEPFLIAMILSLLKQCGYQSGFAEVLPLLKSPDDRVRANAVEALASLDAKASFSCLQPMVEDSNNRVRANVIAALMRNLEFDPKPALMTLVEDPREVYRRSSIFVVAQEPRKEFLEIIEILLDDRSSKVRDMTFEVLGEYVKAGVAGAETIRNLISSRIGLEFQRERFFENAFDRLFLGLLQAEARNLPQNSSGQEEMSSAQKEHDFYVQLGAKAGKAGMLPPEAQAENQRIEAELERLRKEVDPIPASLGKPGPSTDLSREISRVSEEEILRMEMVKLEKRREMMLANVGAEIAGRSSGLTSVEKNVLDPELERVLKMRLFLVPPVGISVLPDVDAGIAEIFDVTMKMYQKHVIPFSAISIAMSACVFSYFLMAAMFVRLSRLVLEILGIASGVILGIGGVLVILTSLGILKIFVTHMMRHYIVGSSPSYSEMVEIALEKKALLGLQIRKIGYLSCWFLGSLVAAILVGGLTQGIIRQGFGNVRFERAFVELGALLGFGLVMVKPYVLYLLAEPVALIIPEKEQSDPLIVSVTLTRPYFRKLLMLYFLATLMMTVITGTTTQILLFLTVLPGYNTLMWLIPLLSEVCLYPLVFSNLVIFTLMMTRKVSRFPFVESPAQSGPG